MKLGQTVPHQHQAQPLTKESLADHSTNFLNYTTALTFAHSGHVYNALTVLSLKSVFDLDTVAYVPNVVGRPTKIPIANFHELCAEAYLVYTRACEAYLAAEDSFRAKIAEAMSPRPLEQEDDDED